MSIGLYLSLLNISRFILTIIQLKVNNLYNIFIYKIDKVSSEWYNSVDYNERGM